MSRWDSRENNFDFLRLALAVLVIYSHAYPLGLGYESTEPVWVLTHGQVTAGAIAVDGFFIMSGFLICASAQHSSGVLTFMRKRVTRIYPGFVVAALLTFLFLVPLAGAGFVYSGAARVGNFLLQTLRLREFDYTHGFAGNPTPGWINGSMWSVSYEFWCYVGVALLLTAGALNRRALIFWLFWLSLAIGVVFRLRGWVLGGKWLGRLLGAPHLWARLLPLYLAGVVFYLYRDRIPLRWELALLSATALFGGCYVYAGMAALIPVAGAYLLFWFAFAARVGVQNTARFGDFSYGTYLYAFPIEQLIVHLHGGPMAPWRLFVLTTPPVLVVAALSWYLVERPFLRPARRKETVLEAIEHQAVRPGKNGLPNG